MKTMFPQVKDAETTRWMGRRPSMPDSRPVIGRATKYANTYYAFGHGHIGLVGSAPTGHIIADLVAGRAPNIDIAPFRVDRF
jgi:D-amino-acid dehydrogenase